MTAGYPFLSRHGVLRCTIMLLALPQGFDATIGTSVVDYRSTVKQTLSIVPFVAQYSKQKLALFAPGAGGGCITAPGLGPDLYL